MIYISPRELEKVAKLRSIAVQCYKILSLVTKKKAVKELLKIEPPIDGYENLIAKLKNELCSSFNHLGRDGGNLFDEKLAAWSSSCMTELDKLNYHYDLQISGKEKTTLPGCSFEEVLSCHKELFEINHASFVMATGDLLEGIGLLQRFSMARKCLNGLFVDDAFNKLVKSMPEEYFLKGYHMDVLCHDFMAYLEGNRKFLVRPDYCSTFIDNTDISGLSREAYMSIDLSDKKSLVKFANEMKTRFQ